MWTENQPVKVRTVRLPRELSRQLPRSYEWTALTAINTQWISFTKNVESRPRSAGWKPEAGSAPPNKEFTAEVMSGTVDQRIDWAAVLSSPLQEGQKFEFTVYDAETGVSHVAASVSGEEEIHTLAGTFKIIRASYRIEKSSGPETYTIFASKDFPRFLVREDFQNGESLQLTEIRSGHD
jgi:hypothetical protein